MHALFVADMHLNDLRYDKGKLANEDVAKGIVAIMSLLGPSLKSAAYL
ncbi:681_t:CDS:2 [Diversispora eburnea]|uniref:681_t:CDS:1 n=1 Tax=Diversispora eburnea TaxID=1213867 RepID=A0A9N9B6J6_9GLOM|nr:681_t:CDS:2 [Diversispora eburnea]